MGLFKTNPFGHILFLKRWLIRIAGMITHQRYKGFNTLEIEGSQIIRDLPETNVLFVSNHQTYFADVVAMFHVFNASLKGRDDNIKNLGYLWSLNSIFIMWPLRKPWEKACLPRFWPMQAPSVLSGRGVQTDKM